MFKLVGALFSYRRVCFVTACVALFASLEPLQAQQSNIAGQWDVTRDQQVDSCRIRLNSVRSDNGDFFAGVPAICRRAMPLLSAVGRWAANDATHLALNDPAGRPVLTLVAEGDGFKATGRDGAVYRMVRVAEVGRSAATAAASRAVADMPPNIVRVASKPAKPASERLTDLAGRYAILRDKTHDTGCMLTLDDKTRVKGGARAALAPACRDQGIVVFDPAAWQIVNGRLVLTAKAGHVTHLDHQEDGTWLKDASEGKSLSLKKL